MQKNWKFLEENRFNTENGITNKLIVSITNIYQCKNYIKIQNYCFYVPYSNV